MKDITYVLAAHYHPDHAGLIGELMNQGEKLLLPDVQTGSVHFPDSIFEIARLQYVPVEESLATVISCRESRSFMEKMGVYGEIIHTPSHSRDSISLISDDGGCFVWDFEPFEHLETYDNNE